MDHPPESRPRRARGHRNFLAIGTLAIVAIIALVVVVVIVARVTNRVPDTARDTATETPAASPAPAPGNDATPPPLANPN